jgi:predicted dehydrogenase
MAFRVGFISVAHMHAHGYAHALLQHRSATLVGLWDDDVLRGNKFAAAYGTRAFDSPDELADRVDAVIVCSENRFHANWIEFAARRGLPVLCEKPLCTTREEAQRIEEANARLMTAFPCRYSPAFQRLAERVRSGDIGTIQAVCATNRGMCPGDWFVDVGKSGGGAMIDHVVHVTDLLRVLLGEEVTRVQAQTGNRMYGESWEDTAMLTLEFESGVFASLDSSWSRHSSYKTWGDVTMNVVGDRGVIELDLFSQVMQVWENGPRTHLLAAYGSDLDAGLVNDFVRCAQERAPFPITGFDGLQASRVAIAGYESAASRSVVALAA